jgi:hypothetical protein
MCRAATAEPAAAAKIPSDKDKRITPKATDFSRQVQLTTVLLV